MLHLNAGISSLSGLIYLVKNKIFSVLYNYFQAEGTILEIPRLLKLLWITGIPLHAIYLFVNYT